MKTFSAAVVFVAVVLGSQQGTDAQNIAEVSDFMHRIHNGTAFLDRMVSHFDLSVEYLLSGNALSGHKFQRPGMGKLLREESDRHWALGIATLKKYIQRGGSTGTRYDKFLENKFTFTAISTLDADIKGSDSESLTQHADDYLKCVKKLVTDSKNTATALNSLHRLAVNRHLNRHDADLAHYFEDNINDEIESLRKFSDLHVNLEKMIHVGLAVDLFDKALL